MGVRFRRARRALAWNAVPARRGDPLNLRDIEQALESFKRMPTVESDIQIRLTSADLAQARNEIA